MSKSSIKNLVRQAIDLHVHIGPEIIPRKFTSVEKLVKAEKGKIGGMTLKNHFYPTQPFISAAKAVTSPRLYGGLVLNNFQGGLNAEAIYANALLSESPTIVWLPTVNARQFLNESEYEIPAEWVQKKSFIARKSDMVQPVEIDSKIEGVLTAIKENNAVLATGHVSWQEAKRVIIAATKKGVQRMIVTHPIYQHIDVPVAEQKKLAKLGAKMEHCYSMFSIDKIPITRIANQIQSVGAENCIMSSDVGQIFSPSPSEALEIFANLLFDEGLSTQELELMMVTNPRKLVAIQV